MEELASPKIQEMKNPVVISKLIEIVTNCFENKNSNKNDIEHAKLICSKLVFNVYMAKLYPLLDDITQCNLVKILSSQKKLTMYALNHVTILKLLHVMGKMDLIDLTDENINKCTSVMTLCYLWENKLFKFAEDFETQALSE